MEKQEFEIRSAELKAENKKLTGYVVRWNSPSELIFGEFIEQFAPNAFCSSLSQGADVRALFEHDYTKLLGRTTSGTLTLSEDNTGLRFELLPPDTQAGRDLLVSVDRGDISGMSFGFRAVIDEWNFDTEPTLRTVKQAELFEITVTSIPAYSESSVEIAKRSMLAAKREQRPDEMRKRWALLALA